MASNTFGTIKEDIKILTIESKAIEGNMLENLSARQVEIYLPAGWDKDGK